MPYKLIDTHQNNYQIYSGTPFVNFDAFYDIRQIFESQFGDEVQFKEVSSRIGRSERSESLIELIFNSNKFKADSIFIYCFQTEGGGRWRLINDGMNEARVQWRSYSQWSPILSKFPIARDTATAFLKQDESIKGRCYLLSVYKRSKYDEDILFSGFFPTQAQNIETSSKSNKSIQFKYQDIRKAYKDGISYTLKKNDHLVVHFKPKYLLWYLIMRDDIHNMTEWEIDKYLSSEKVREDIKDIGYDFFGKLQMIIEDDKSTIIKELGSNYFDSNDIEQIEAQVIKELIKKGEILKAYEKIILNVSQKHKSDSFQIAQRLLRTLMEQNR